MTVGVGGDVAQAATLEQPRVDGDWHSRFLAAFGGAVVVVCLIMLSSSWSQGLRPATFDDLRQDLGQGGVQEWYAADTLVTGDLDFLEAHQSSVHSEVVSDEGVVTSSSTSSTGTVGDPTGGILVWRSWGSGWKVAAADSDLRSTAGMGAEAGPESSALVGELRRAGVAMRPFDDGQTPTWENLARAGGLVVLLGLIAGAARAWGRGGSGSGCL